MLFSPQSKQYRSDSTIRVRWTNDPEEENPYVYYPAPFLREIPWFPNRASENEPKKESISNPSEDVTVYKGRHWASADYYKQSYYNAPYWRYTGYIRTPPTYMLVDASNPLLLSMPIAVDGSSGSFTIGSVNSGKLLFKRKNLDDSELWINYEPVFNITRREYMTSEESGMSLRFSTWNQRTTGDGWGLPGIIAPPCWHIIINNNFNDDYYPIIFIPSSFYGYFDGTTKELRKWYWLNKPPVLDPNSVYDWSIPDGISGQLSDADVSHGTLSPQKETSFVICFIDYRGGTSDYGGFVRHTVNTAKLFPKINVVPTTL